MRPLPILIILLSFSVTLILPGCSILNPTPQAQYYVLSSPAQPNQADTRPQGPRIGLLPPELPGYLQRPQMVLREGDSVDMRMETYHRWGEDLGTGMARVLTSYMSQDLDSINALVLPLRMGVPVDWRVQVAVRRFEGAPGSTATLEVSWVFQNEGKVIRDGTFAASTQAGPDISSLVEAQSRLLAQFARELSAHLLPLVQ